MTVPFWLRKRTVEAAPSTKKITPESGCTAMAIGQMLAAGQDTPSPVLAAVGAKPFPARW
jgi:hypothetical protein